MKSGDKRLITALNTSDFRGSLKEAYQGKSMALPFQARFVTRQRSNSSTEDTNSEKEEETLGEDFNKEEVKMMEKFEIKGYRIVEKDERQHKLILERQTDEIKCRANRPQVDLKQ